MEGIFFCHNHLLTKPNICADFERNRSFELYHLLPGSAWFSHGHTLKQLERRSLKKNQGFNGIRTRDFRDTGAMLYQLSYEATHWERGQLVEFISPAP